MGYYQYAIDNAESISISRKTLVASTQSRDGTVRQVSRGVAQWQFEVKLPDGIAWTDARGYISNMEYLQSVLSTDEIKLNNSGHAWLSKYQGDSVNYTGFVASFTQGNNYLTLTTSPTTSSGYKFRAGDFIQLGSAGKVYTVAADVAYNSNTVVLHRPIVDATATGVSLKVGPNAAWNVVCTQFPSWTLFARDQVAWSGPFIFAEVMV